MRGFGLRNVTPKLLRADSRATSVLDFTCKDLKLGNWRWHKEFDGTNAGFLLLARFLCQVMPLRNAATWGSLPQSTSSSQCRTNG